MKLKFLSIHLEVRSALKGQGTEPLLMSDMHEVEETDEQMPEHSGLWRTVPAARLKSFVEVESIVAGGGDIDWPPNLAVGAASEP